MKKLVTLAAILGVFLSCAAAIDTVGSANFITGVNTINVEAYTGDFSQNGIEYTILAGNTTVKVSGYTGEGGAVTIPATVTYDGVTYDVVEIGNYAFDSCSELATVTFAENSQLKTIGEHAFAYCSKLETVTFAEGSQLKTIGDDAFDSCIELTEIEISASVTSIGQYAFFNCTALANVTFAENSQLQTIGQFAFANCPALNDEITLPNTDKTTWYSSISTAENTKINNANRLSAENSKITQSNYDCSFVTRKPVFADGSSNTTTYGSNIILDEANGVKYKIKTVANGSTAGTVSVSEMFNNNVDAIKIPATVTVVDSNGKTYTYNVTEIGDYAFYQCKELETVTFAENSQIETIGDSAFAYCSELTEIKIPASVETIGYYAFYQCKELETVTFAENSQLQTIGQYAFANCPALNDEITLPNTDKTTWYSSTAEKTEINNANRLSAENSKITARNCGYSFVTRKPVFADGSSNTTTYGSNIILDEANGVKYKIKTVANGSTAGLFQ